ncbi:MAG: class II glutamine amidotransferase [Myxococcales bacterium]|nr:class II glutamine amidotransferase [Myxococcales bacterium]
MCRLFGFRSVIQSQVHRSLVAADNALAVQSESHRDGWGVAYYVADSPHLIKGTSPAVEDQIFTRVSGVVASETVLAHLRLATAGDVNILNAHPFQYGRWVFGHNGKIIDWPNCRDALCTHVAPNLRRFILGDTDSEVIFYLFLTSLARRVDLHRRGTAISDVSEALSEALALVREVCDPGPEAGDDAERALLTMVVTDGNTMVATCGGKPLRFSTYKTKCADRDTCPFLTDACEAETADGHVNHLIVSSEALQGENIWTELKDGETVGVDWRMVLHRGQLGSPMAVVKAP